MHGSGLGGLVVNALDFQVGSRGLESRSGRGNFQTICTSGTYSTYPGLSIKWTGRRMVTDSGIKCAWVIHESKAVKIHVQYNRHCLYGCVKNLDTTTKMHGRNVEQGYDRCYTIQCIYTYCWVTLTPYHS